MTNHIRAFLTLENATQSRPDEKRCHRKPSLAIWSPHPLPYLSVWSADFEIPVFTALATLSSPLHELFAPRFQLPEKGCCLLEALHQNFSSESCMFHLVLD